MHSGSEAKGEKDVFQRLQSFWLGESSEPFSDRVLELAYEPVRVGGMVECDARAVVLDGCGDAFEIFLKINDGRVADATFLSDGCGAVMACGSALCEWVVGKTVREAEGATSEDVIRRLDGLPSSHRHCADQAVQALHSALESVGRRSPGSP